MIIILASSVVLGAFLVYTEAQRGGMQEAWSFSEIDLAGKPANISLMYQGSDGTIYAFESQSYYPNYFMALDSSGTVKWRTGVNAQPYPVQGADDGFYYVDWPFITVWMDDPSKGGWYNLTALDSSGNFKWNYVVDNGTLSLLATYDDGTVIAHHYNSEFDNTTQTYVTLIDTIIELSNNGTVLWEIDRPLPNLTFQDPRISPNGTILINAYDSNGTYEIGIYKNGTEGYIIPAQFAPGYTPGPYSVRNGVQYEVRREYTENQTSVINVYATNTSDGGQRWKTLLEYSDNPDNFTAGYWVGQDTFVDNDGIIYCGDIVGKHTYGLNPDGSVRWQIPYQGVIWETYKTGGVLVSDATSIRKVNQDGSTAWQYGVGQFGTTYSRVLLNGDRIVYYSTGTEVISLVHPSGIGGNSIILIVLVVFDMVVFGLYGREIWMKRKGGKPIRNETTVKAKKDRKRP
jgi:hypothetical protein